MQRKLKLVDHSKRWEIFKQKKQVAIDAYLRAKKKQRRAEWIAKPLYVCSMVRVIFSHYHALKQRKIRQGRIMFIAIKVKSRFSQRMKKQRGFRSIQVSRLRNVLSFAATT